MKIFRVIVPVRDIEKATLFYKDLLGIAGERISTGRHYFDCGGVVLACFDPRADGDDFDACANPDHIYLSVHDLESVFKRAQKAECSYLEKSIQVRPWGERSFYLKDPFGNPLCFVDESTVYTGGDMK